MGVESQPRHDEPGKPALRPEDVPRAIKGFVSHVTGLSEVSDEIANECLHVLTKHGATIRSNIEQPDETDLERYTPLLQIIDVIVPPELPPGSSVQ